MRDAKQHKAFHQQKAIADICLVRQADVSLKTYLLSMKKGGNKIVLKRYKVQGGNQWVWVSAVNWKREFQSELVCGGEKEITPAKSKIHAFISHQDPLIGRVHCVSILSLDVGESTEAFFFLQCYLSLLACYWITWLYIFYRERDNIW